MNIFKKPATWLVLLGANGALFLDSLTEADFVSVAVNGVGMAVCGVMLDQIKGRTRAESGTGQ